MRRLPAIQKSDFTAVLLRHFFGYGGWGSIFSIFFLFSFLFSLGAFAQSRPDQPPAYNHLFHKDLPTVTASLSTFSVNSEDLTIAIATDPQGNVYTLSFGKGVDKRDADGNLLDGNFINGLSSPLDIAIDDDGYIYIADFEASGSTYLDNGQIEIYDPNGNYVRSILTSYFRPLGVEVDNEFIYIAEYNDGKQGPESTPSSRIRKIDKITGAVVASNNTVSVPYRIAVNSQGRVYVSKAGGGSAVLILSNDLTVQGQLTGIQSPGSIEVDVFDYVHVLEYAGRVDFSRFINFASMSFGEIRNIAEAIDKGIDAEAFGVKIFDSAHNQLSFFKQLVDFPVDIAFNSCDRMYINNGDMFGGNVFLVGYVPQKLEFDLEVYQRSPSADVTPPVAQCVGNVTIDLAAGETRTLTKDDFDGGSFDLCGEISFLLSKSSFSEADEGSNAVNLIVTDEHGLSSICQVIVQVNVEDTPDTTDPVFTFCENQTFSAATGECGAIVNYTIPAATDNPGVVTVTLTSGPAPGSLFSVGPTTVTYSATDAAGNSAECTFTITVTDNEDPTVTCPENIIEIVAIGETGKIITYTVPFSDNCSGSTIQQTSGQASGTVFPLGETVNSFVVTDASGKTATCSFKVTINAAVDEEDPVITCPQSINTVAEAGACGANVTYEFPTATDNAGPPVVTKISGPDSGEFFPVGPTTVTYTATDAAGNSAECTFTITVTDNEDPTVTCPENITETVAIGETGKIITYTVPSSDNCPASTIQQTAGQASGTVFPLGETVNSFVVTDASGMTATCSFKVTINAAVDEEDPVITCPQSINTVAEAGACGANVTFEFPTATDNAGPPVVTKISGPDSGEFFPVGETDIVFEAKDDEGNTAVCTLTVTVQDKEAPVFTRCVEDVQFISPEDGKYLVPNLITQVQANDNCSQNITYTQSISFGTEITTNTVVNIFAYDQFGNESKACSIELVLVEEEQPSFDCGTAAGTLDLDENCNHPERDFRYLITNRQNFTSEPFIEQIEEREGNVLKVNLRVYNGSDNTGDFVGECKFEFRLIDSLAPVIQNCDSSTVKLDLSPGESFIVPNYSGRITFTDNCNVLTVVQVPGVGSTITQNTTVSLMVRDEAGNSSNVCSFSIEYNETPNSISCRTAEVALGAQGTATLDPASVFDGTPSDPAIQSLVVSPSIFGCGDLGLQPVELTVNYKDGSSASCSTQIEVVDSILPDMACGEITESFDPQVGYTIPDYTDILGTNDNCSFTVSQSPPPGTVVFESLQVDYIVEDLSGNKTSCFFILRLTSPQEFNITTCPSSRTEEITEDCELELPDYTGEIETSEPYVNIIQLPSPGTRISEATEVSLTVTGLSGGTDTCTFMIGPVDTTSPTLACPDDITVKAGAGEVFSLPDYRGLAEVSDNCNYTITQSPAPGVGITGRETEIAFSVTDEAGLSATCSFTLILDEDVPLEISCPGDQSESLGDNCSFELPDYAAMASVTWPTAQVTQEPPAGSMVSASTSVILTASDGTESASCSFMLELVDDVPPVIICRENFEIFLNEEGYGILSAEILLESAVDNCGIQSATLSKTRFETTDVGQNEVVVTVTDINGNEATCTTSVTVTPFEQSGGISCTASITLPLNEEGEAELRLTYTGNDENIALELSKSNFTCNDIGPQVITATYFGEFTGSCEIEIVVIDNLRPVVNCVSEIDLLLDENGEARLSVNDVDLGSTDNCGIEGMSLSKTLFAGLDVGSQEVRLTVTDESGNSDFCEVIVNVKPYLATTGELNCVGDLTLELDSNGEAVLRAQDLFAGDPEGVEFFGEVTYKCDDIGIHTVTLTKKDDPAQSCEVEVEVVDNLSPVAVCVPDFEVRLDANGSAVISAAEVGSGSSDNCAIATYSLNRSTFTTADLGQQQVRLTVTDGSGNTDFCETTITILPNEDTPPPVACVDLFTLRLNATGRAELNPRDLFTGGTQDGTYTVDRSGFSCADLGENSVTLTYSTPNEQGSCIVKVVVEDPQAFCDNVGPGGDLLILYPNPGDGLIKFKLSPGLEIHRIEVFDIRGRFIMEHKYDNTAPSLPYTLDLRAYQAGVYPMLIYTNGKEYLKRAIIK